VAPSPTTAPAPAFGFRARARRDTDNRLLAIHDGSQDRSGRGLDAPRGGEDVRTGSALPHYVGWRVAIQTQCHQHNVGDDMRFGLARRVREREAHTCQPPEPCPLVCLEQRLDAAFGAAVRGPRW
jgi:hypothetical protein